MFFHKIVSFKLFDKLWGNLYIQILVLILLFFFTCGERKLCYKISFVMAYISFTESVDLSIVLTISRVWDSFIALTHSLTHSPWFNVIGFFIRSTGHQSLSIWLYLSSFFIPVINAYKKETSLTQLIPK